MGQPPQGESWADPGEPTEAPERSEAPGWPARTDEDGGRPDELAPEVVAPGAVAPPLAAPHAWPAPDQPDQPSARPDVAADPHAPVWQQGFGGPAAPVPQQPHAGPPAASSPQQPFGSPAGAPFPQQPFGGPAMSAPAQQTQPGVPAVPVAPPGWGNPGAPAAAPPGGPAGQSMYGARPEPAPAPAQATGSFGQFTFPVIPQQPLEPLAVAGVATAPLGVVGVVLGLLARGRVRRRRTRSMRLAWTGVALGAVFTVVWVLVGSVLAFDGTLERAFESPEQGDVDSARTIASANLAVGNCIATLQPAVQVGDVRLVPCAEAHVAQVVSVEEQSGAFPGDTPLAERALEVCTAAVDGLDTGENAVEPWYLVPSETGWSQGNTNVICLLRASAGPIQGDLVNT